MGDLERLLQDFSYLKSLEQKNQTPRKLSRKLHLADPTCHHIVRKIFEKTKESTFDRIFHRPFGHRCFQYFLESPEYTAKNPCGRLALQFIITVKNLLSQPPSAALETIEMMKKEYLQSQLFVENNVCQLPDLMAELEAKRASFQAKADALYSNNVNVKDIFQGFITPCKDFLSMRPWDDFKDSTFYIRYCQLKHLELNQKITLEDFDVLRILGRGGFGEVFACRKHDTGAVFAMKCLDKRRLKLKHQEASSVHERNVLAEMHSKFVTNLKYAFHNDETLFLVLDLMEGGDLSYHLKKRSRFSDAESRFYAAEICMGLAHIHSRQMIYRDLKPANVLLDGNGHARISDLGLVRDIRKSLPTSECGTHGYMAPEVLKPNATYDTSADWWSLGCVIFHMLVGYSPFRGPSKKISKNEVDRRTMDMVVEFPATMSADARDIIWQLLDRNVKTRLGCRGRGVSEVRNHPWFSSIDWQALADHQLEPPIKPSSSQVNAKDVFDIERFDQEETKKVVVSQADNDKYYKNFYHVMSHQWQEEILDSNFDLIMSRADAAEAKKAHALASLPLEPQEPILMQGYLLKHGGLFHRSWQRRYFELLADRIQWREEQQHPIKQVVQLAEIKKFEEIDLKSIKTFQIVTEKKTFVMRTEYDSDYEIWVEMLQAQVSISKHEGPSGERLQNKHSKLSVSSMNIIDEVTSPAPQAPTSSEADDSFEPAPRSQPQKHEKQGKKSKDKDKDDDSVAATSSGGGDIDQ